MAQSNVDPLNKAIQRRLGLDSPEGKTAFLAQFKSSHPANFIERDGQDLYPMLREEMVSKLAGEM